MRRFFNALVILAIAVAFFRSDLSDDLLGGTGDSLTDWFNELAAAAEEKSMIRFRKEAQSIFAGLKPHQIEYANHVMKDRETLAVFHQRYCQGDDKNPYIYGVTLNQFCEMIVSDGVLKS